MDSTSTNNPTPVTNSNLTFMSYNVTGWTDTKINFVNVLLQAHGLLLCGLQEHFQLENNLYRINCFRNYEVFSVAASKSNNIVHRGRPSGGISILYHQSLCKFATQLRVPNSLRVQGLKLNIPNIPILVINTYFPNDPQTVDFDDSELLQTLEDIKYLVDSVDNNYTIILMGDLNSDFARNTTFVNIVKNFCTEIDVESVWSFHQCDFTLYHERAHRNRTVVSQSVIDHFCISSPRMNLCLEATALHIPENRSFHDPIYLKLDTTVQTPHLVDSLKPDTNKLQWNRATPEQISLYKRDLSTLLYNIEVDEPALSCDDLHCNSNLHKNAIEDMCQNVFESISIAVSNNIPHAKNNSQIDNPLPGWNDSVKEFKDISLFWKMVWISAGRPLDNELHRIMKRSRNKYH